MSGIEAMAMGTPIVAAKVPGWMDLVEEGSEGFLVRDGDFDGYAHAIERIVDEPDLRARMSTAARNKAVRFYDVRLCVHDWERLFLEAKRGHPE